MGGSCLQWGKKLLVGAFVLALAACGGGGGGTDTTAPSSGTSAAGGTTALATATYTLSWNAVSDPNVTGYRIYYNTAPLSSGGAKHVDVGLSSTTVDFAPGSYGIASGATLYAAVSSTGAGGVESPISSQVSVAVQ